MRQTGFKVIVWRDAVRNGLGLTESKSPETSINMVAPMWTTSRRPSSPRLCDAGQKLTCRRLPPGMDPTHPIVRALIQVAHPACLLCS